jgi:flagellar basal-body rod protein FlgB
VVNFKASRVEFEDQMLAALGNAPRNRSVDLSGVEPVIHRDPASTMHRIDGNNVDIEAEMVRLYQNSMRFDTLVSSVMANSRRLSTVLG